RCFGTRIVTTPEEAAEQAATTACKLVPRDLNNGAALNAMLSYDNQATIKTSGMDIAWNWLKPLSNASLNFNLQATVLNEYKTKASPAPFDPEIDWKGSLGPIGLTGTNPGAFDYRLFGSVGYSRNNWNVSLRWRHLPSVWSASYAQQQAIKENNARVAAGEPGLMLSWTPSTEIKSDDYNVFDLSFRWDLTDAMTLRGGVTNLFDTKPKVVGASRGYPTDTVLSNVCSDLGYANNAMGCQN